MYLRIRLWGHEAIAVDTTRPAPPPAPAAAPAEPPKGIGAGQTLTAERTWSPDHTAAIGFSA